MEDRELVRLYNERNQKAISGTVSQYGSYCRTIAWNILSNREDTEECLNDTWLAAWNSIPPEQPVSMRAYLGKLTRSKAIDRWKYNHAQRRNSQVNAALEELADCIPSDSDSDPEQRLMGSELTACLRSFLLEQRELERQVFLLRYWYLMPEKQIAKRVGMTRGGVSAMLTRMRRKLKKYLKEQGEILI